jgi:hypothetical protein
MSTKAARDKAQTRALLRLASAARLSAGDLQTRGRTGEARAYLDVAEFLEAIAAWGVSSGRGLPVAGRLPGL